MDNKIADPIQVDLTTMRQWAMDLENRNAQLQQTHAELSQEVAEQSALLREVGNQFANSLVPVVGLLYAKRRLATVEKDWASQVMISELISQVSAVSVAYRLLANSEWNTIPLSALIGRVVRETLQTLPQSVPISVEVVQSPLHIPAIQAKNLALIFNELTMNTLKHIQDRATAGHIVVDITLKPDQLQDEQFASSASYLYDECKEQGGCMVHLEFRDDGPGYPRSVLFLENDDALYLIRSLVRSLPHGEFSIHNDGGAVSVIRFHIDSFGNQA
jgi:two-component sensor histidine kinase